MRVTGVTRDEKLASHLAVNNYVYISQYSMDDNIAYLEKIVAKHARLHDGVGKTERDSTEAFLKAVSNGDGHREIRTLASDFLAQFNTSRAVNGDVAGWVIVTQSFRTKYHELLNTGRIKPKVAGTAAVAGQGDDETAAAANTERPFKRQRYIWWRW